MLVQFFSTSATICTRTAMLWKLCNFTAKVDLLEVSSCPGWKTALVESESLWENLLTISYPPNPFDNPLMLSGFFLGTNDPNNTQSQPKPSTIDWPYQSAELLMTISLATVSASNVPSLWRNSDSVKRRKGCLGFLGWHQECIVVLETFVSTISNIIYNEIT